MPDLARDWTLEQALAYDGGPPPRVPTTAHPDCRCGRLKPRAPRHQDHPEDYGQVLAAWVAEHGSALQSHYERRDCPQHRPARRGGRG